MQHQPTCGHSLRSPYHQLGGMLDSNSSLGQYSQRNQKPRLLLHLLGFLRCRTHRFILGFRHNGHLPMDTLWSCNSCSSCMSGSSGCNVEHEERIPRQRSRAKQVLDYAGCSLNAFKSKRPTCRPSLPCWHLQIHYSGYPHSICLPSIRSEDLNWCNILYRDSHHQYLSVPISHTTADSLHSETVRSTPSSD